MHRGGSTPGNTSRTWSSIGVAGEVLYPSQGLFYFKVADPIPGVRHFRASMIGSPSFVRADPARLGHRDDQSDDVPDGIKELQHAAASRLVGAMSETELRRLGCRRSPRHAAEPAHGHATAGQNAVGVGDMTVQDTSGRATKAFYPALSMCD